MGNFNRNDNSGGRGNYGGGSSRSYGGGSNRSFGGGGGGFGGGDREMFKATCASCGKECEVPFKPNGSRPVYCSDCFKKNAPQDSGGGMDRDRSRDRRRGLEDRQMFNAVCDNCGDKCQLPFMPREGKEVLCSKCFEEKGGDPRKNNGQSSAQIEALNAKLDRILELLGEKAPRRQELASTLGVKAPKKEKKEAHSASSGQETNAPLELPLVETEITEEEITPESPIEMNEQVEIKPKAKKAKKKTSTE